MRFLGFAVALAVLSVTGAENVKEVCYRLLSCFNNSYPFNDFAFLPQSPEDIGLKFLLYTPKNRHSADVLSFAHLSAFTKTHFDSKLKVKVAIHGYLSSTTRPWMNELKDALLEKGNFNILLVDWSGGSGINYLHSAANTRVVAAAVKRLLDMMIAIGVSWDDIHLIGHSLGAQISAMIGYASGSKVGRISGLDPAGPSFQDKDLSIRLNKGDAKFVDVIHTNMNPFLLFTGYGTNNPSGHVDFYPNGGSKQPGCALSGNVGCSHKRSHDLYVDSVRYPCPFVAFPCQSYNEFENGHCTNCGLHGCSRMGYYADQDKGRGGFYLDTQDESPYCGYAYVVKIVPDSKAEATKGELYISAKGPHYTTSEVSVTKHDVQLNSTSISRVVLFDQKIDDLQTINIRFDKSGFILHRPDDYRFYQIQVTNPTTSKTFYTCPGSTVLGHKKVKSIPVKRGHC